MLASWKWPPISGFAVQDNPRQRDTEGRAARAKHLRVAHPTHARVNMARLPDGSLIKLDGHTRAHVWAAGVVAPPVVIYADVYECASIEEVKALYATFDSRAAAETVTDQVFGSIREHGAQFSSELLKSQRFAGALRTATALLLGHGHLEGRTVYDFFEYWLPELRLLDECQPTRKRFHTGIATAALLTFRRYGPEAGPFWKTFAAGGGTKIGGKRDAIQALEERMESLRGNHLLTSSANVSKVVRIALSAFDAHLNDYMYAIESSGIKTLGANSFERWMIAARKTKRWWK
jgi:hypothetical protein